MASSVFSFNKMDNASSTNAAKAESGYRIEKPFE